MTFFTSQQSKKGFIPTPMRALRTFCKYLSSLYNTYRFAVLGIELQTPPAELPPQRCRGFTLVETLVAVTILLFAIVGPMTIASQSIKAAQFAREELTAVFLAQEGIELVLERRDNDALNVPDTTWDWYDMTLPAGCKLNSGCGLDALGSSRNCSSQSCTLKFDSSGTNFYYYGSGGIVSKYTRVITVQKDATLNEVEVISTVTW